MSKSGLDKLIEQVLNERGIPVTLRTGSGSTNYNKGELGLTGKPSMDKLRALAAAETPDAELTVDDLNKAFEYVGSTRPTRANAEAALEMYFNSSLDTEVKDIIKQAYIGSKYQNSSYNQGEYKKKMEDELGASELISDRVKIFWNKIINKMHTTARQNINTGDQGPTRQDIFQQARAQLEKNKDLSTVELAALDQLYTAYDETGDLPTPDMPQYRTVKTSDDWQQSKDFGQIPSATLQVFTNFSKGLKTADEITERLIKFSKLFRNTGQRHFLKKVAAEDPGLVLSAAMVLKLFSRVMREIEALEAGKFFESWCALLYSGRVVGGEAGASDVYFYAANGAKVNTSQKLYASLEGISQAEGEKTDEGKGVWSDTQDFEPLWYFSAVKTEAPAKASSRRELGSGGVTLYTCGVKRVVDKDIYFLVDKDGNDTDIQVQTKQGESGSPRVLIGLAMTKNEALFRVGNIYTAPVVDPDAFRSYDSLLNKQFDKIGNDAIQAVRGVYKKSKTLEVNSTKYSQTDDFSEQMGLADGLITNYNDLKSDLDDMIRLFSQEEEEAAPETTTKRQGLAEGDSPLDHLIESIIKQKLLK